ncbi:MAG TPA: hypothetical protein VKR06_08655 [Ktedonosporobacter sp.]|nr:hypothetical protein [Ktedonosporobacter sp.]
MQRRQALLSLSVAVSRLFGIPQYPGALSNRPANPPPNGLIDDSQISIHTAQDIESKRQALGQFIWGSSGFPQPTLLPSKVLQDICHSSSANIFPAKDPCSFSGTMTNLARVDEIHVVTHPLHPGLAYHFVPAQSNNQLVVVHQGHVRFLSDTLHGSYPAGVSATIRALVKAGYGVLGVYMPHTHPDDPATGCIGTDAHDAMFGVHNACAQLYSAQTGSPLQYFLDPVAFSLNYLKTHSASDNFPEYRIFHMIGLSGGGWTTTVYSAIDPTIQVSIPVAGSLPLYLRPSPDDGEQAVEGFYKIAGYPDLYVLGAYGASRKQIQVLNRYDACCFGDTEYRSGFGTFDRAVQEYEKKVRETLTHLGQGSFTLIIDEKKPSSYKITLDEDRAHWISQWAIDNVILPQLATGFVASTAANILQSAFGSD